MSENSDRPKRLIVGISGASGTIYGVRTLEVLRETDIETHLVMSKSAEVTLAYELDMKVADIHALADVVHPIHAIGASIPSGSFHTAGMIVAPCAIRSMSAIAVGTTENLLTRSADVVRKARRRLVLLAREAPLHLGHVRTMAQVTEMGAIIMPPVPAFYARPKTIDDIVNHTVGRALDLFGFDLGMVKRWGEESGRLDESVRRARKTQ